MDKQSGKRAASEEPKAPKAKKAKSEASSDIIKRAADIKIKPQPKYKPNKLDMPGVGSVKKHGPQIGTSLPYANYDNEQMDLRDMRENELHRLVIKHDTNLIDEATFRRKFKAIEQKYQSRIDDVRKYGSRVKSHKEYKKAAPYASYTGFHREKFY